MATTMMIRASCQPTTPTTASTRNTTASTTASTRARPASDIPCLLSGSRWRPGRPRERENPGPPTFRREAALAGRLRDGLAEDSRQEPPDDDPEDHRTPRKAHCYLLSADRDGEAEPGLVHE